MLGETKFAYQFRNGTGDEQMTSELKQGVAAFGKRLSLRNVRTAIAGLALLTLFAGVIAVTLRPGKEPLYDGKSLSWCCKQWFMGHTNAEFAIQQIGTNAIPWLLDDLHAQRSKLKAEVNQYLFNRGGMPLFYDRCDRGLGGFYALGGLGQVAIPQLESLLGNDPDGRWRLIVTTRREFPTIS